MTMTESSIACEVTPTIVAPVIAFSRDSCCA
jgi:hypothetical protein